MANYPAHVRVSFIANVILHDLAEGTSKNILAVGFFIKELFEPCVAEVPPKLHRVLFSGVHKDDDAVTRLRKIANNAERIPRPRLRHCKSGWRVAPRY